MRRIVRPAQGEMAALKDIAAVDTSKGFSPMRDFCRMLRALVAAYPTQTGMTTMYNRYLWGHSYSACAQKTFERYMRNERIRMHIGKDLVEFAAFGTTGSEAVDAELKAWPDRIANPRAPIIRLKLRIFHVSKPMAFCSAKYNEATVQERKSLALRRVRRDIAAFFGEWDSWRDAQPLSAAPNKTTLWRHGRLAPKSSSLGRD